MNHLFRRLRRCFWILALAAQGLGHYALLRLRGRLTLNERARWLQIYTARLLPHIGVRFESAGGLPRTGLIASNHLSYVDILVYSAALGCSFVSKAEVRSWPLFGAFAQLSGTVFVWRHSASDSVRAYEELTECLKTGYPVVLFPEATTSDSLKILPFRSTMFQAAIDAGVAVTPAAIGYEMKEGSVADDICFWGEMTPLPHAWNLFSKDGIECRLRFGDPLPGDQDRKRIARRAYEWTLGAAPAFGGAERLDLGNRVIE